MSPSTLPKRQHAHHYRHHGAPGLARTSGEASSFPSSEIYGGIGSSYDYGPLGTELKRNVKEAWWQAMVRERGTWKGLDSVDPDEP